MEADKRTLLKGFVVACILGLIIVAALVLYGSNIHILPNSTSEGNSLFFFEGFPHYLKVVEFGKPVNLTFNIESREKDPMVYNYSIKYDNEQLRSGKINLQPGDSVSIPFSFVPNETFLVKLPDTDLTISRLRSNGRLGTLVNQDERKMDVIIPDKVIVPIKPWFANPKIQEWLLMLDPSKKESFTINNSTLNQVAGSYEITTPPERDEVSNFGYDIKNEMWTIENDHGDLNITRRYSVAHYRYGFKNVSAKVLKIRGGVVLSSKGLDLSSKDIDFWVIVEKNPEDLIS
jgi:hypothetical protein